ncbi:MAG: hypothetical protein LBU38_08280 [Propionibacteriaceae bacterium]|jgi:hypothetical protein|nr:hypothetical protein [Propionibacteriaceae bacterium]
MKIRNLVCHTVAVALASCGLVVATAQGPIAVTEANAAKPKTPAAVTWLANQVTDAGKKIYVYRDFADGVNAFTQRMWISNDVYHKTTPPAMNEKAKAYKGTSAIKASIDFTKFSWGGYGFQVGVLPAGATTPKLNFGQYNAGLNLTGAATLHFWARGDKGGEVVRFYMGGLGKGQGLTYPDSAPEIDKGSGGQIKLTKKWKHFTINVKKANLTRIANGFAWIASSAKNRGKKKISFSVDEIYYSFSKPTTGPLFLPSYAAAPLSDARSAINGFSYTYDQALSAILLAKKGKHAQARRLADGLVYAINNDRYFTDGRVRNAYSSGDPRSMPGWYATNSEGKSVRFARLPGFYDTATGRWKEDAYAVSTSTGNQAWAILALTEVYERAGRNPAYLQAAVKAADFVLNKLRSPNGGFLGGYEGWEGASAAVSYKSTEHNIDLISAFARLSRLVKASRNTGLAAKANGYAAASTWARNFVFGKMYDSKRQLFYTGTSNDNPASPNHINKSYPLDVNAWALLVNPKFADAKKIMAAVERNFAKRKYGGYDFSTRRKGIWWEGTGEVAMAYKAIGDKAHYKKVLKYMNSKRTKAGTLPAASIDGLNTGLTVSGTNLPWVYPKRVHLGAVGWLGLAQEGFNPLTL